MSTFYLPVATPEMIAMAQKLDTGRQGKGKAGYNIIRCTDTGASKWVRRKLGLGLLAGIANPEKLYVLLHGLVNAQHEPVGRIGVRRGATPVAAAGKTKWTGGVMRFYTPDGLADHLEAEELSKQFIDLRLFCCHSGVASANLPGNVSFARALRDALHANGYNAIVVTGYLGALADGYNFAQFEINNKGIAQHPNAAGLTATEHKYLSGTDQVASLHKVQY